MPPNTPKCVGWHLFDHCAGCDKDALERSALDASQRENSGDTLASVEAQASGHGNDATQHAEICWVASVRSLCQQLYLDLLSGSGDRQKAVSLAVCHRDASDLPAGIDRHCLQQVQTGRVGGNERVEVGHHAVLPQKRAGVKVRVQRRANHLASVINAEGEARKVVLTRWSDAKGPGSVPRSSILPIFRVHRKP